MTQSISKTQQEKLDYYLSLPYTIEVIQDVEEDGTVVWFAQVAELPGCMTESNTFAELEEMIKDAMISWIETALADSQTVPKPRSGESYSGKFVVRVPKSLHRELAEAAEQDGVSLNTFINVALARSLGTYSVSTKTENSKADVQVTTYLPDAA
ncbi:MAG: type II toxin-antitoxin system HicB family antitoxin [Anaerolineae bacterium]|nr:type II toxin-antitoxin system HicB family antitoxin [Anaerolineae bacterium]